MRGGFDSRYLLHVAVVQLVEHQIVALVVVDSSSTGHPIKKLFFQEEMKMEIMLLENRITLLTNRDAIGNARIINKLKRRLKRLRDAV